MPRGYCAEGQHYPRVLLVAPALEPELMILADNAGIPTGAWEDGTIGITDAQRAFALEEETAYCREHLEPVQWHHG